MPILHVGRTSQTVEAQDGEEVSVSPEEALVHDGPLIEVSIGVTGSVAEQWRNSGIGVPEPISGRALIDTGASITCVDEEVANTLGVPVREVVTMVSATEEIEKNVYPIQMDVAGSELTIDAPQAAGANLQEQGLVALVGRDVLSHTTLHYNGPAGEYTLSM